jgi:hypothetical protein
VLALHSGPLDSLVRDELQCYLLHAKDENRSHLAHRKLFARSRVLVHSSPLHTDARMTHLAHTIIQSLLVFRSRTVDPPQAAKLTPAEEPAVAQSNSDPQNYKPR